MQKLIFRIKYATISFKLISEHYCLFKKAEKLYHIPKFHYKLCLKFSFLFTESNRTDFKIY